MKQLKKLMLIIGLGLMYSTTFLSCNNANKSNAEGSGQTDNIRPSASDETRYNLSEQQKMSMQKDTTLLDTIQHDSLKDTKHPL